MIIVMIMGGGRGRRGGAGARGRAPERELVREP